MQIGNETKKKYINVQIHHFRSYKYWYIQIILSTNIICITCKYVYLLISSTAKSYNFPKLSEAWVIFQGSKPDGEEKGHDKTMYKNRTIEQFHLMELHSMQKWNLNLTKLYYNFNNILRINNEHYVIMFLQL